jgi:antitoxin Xre/MbcA/ParS-like protein
MAKKSSAHAVDEEKEAVLAEIAEIVLDPDAWLDTPNDRFGGQPPRVLLESEKGRDILHSLVVSYKHGMVT